MTVDDLTCVNVTDNALVEFIECIAVAGSTDIKVSRGDKGWHVIYRPPFTRDIKKDSKCCSSQMIAEADCNGDINICGDVCHAKSK